MSFVDFYVTTPHLLDLASMFLRSSTRCTTSAFRLLPKNTFNQSAKLSTSFINKMPDPLLESEVNSKTDPSVAKQYDHETPMTQQFQEFYDFTNSMKIGLMATNRAEVGPVARSMAIAKRNGPDFLFLANNHSKKFTDLEHDKRVQISFQNSTSQDWASVTGQATVVSNNDPRIKEIWSKGTKAWFGDLGDGKHDGGPDDPRMTLIEVKSNYITYWKSTVGMLGFMKEVTVAPLTGQVANTGLLREMGKDDIEKARSLA